MKDNKEGKPDWASDPNVYGNIEYLNEARYARDKDLGFMRTIDEADDFNVTRLYTRTIAGAHLALNKMNGIRRESPDLHHLATHVDMAAIWGIMESIKTHIWGGLTIKLLNSKGFKAAVPNPENGDPKFQTALQFWYMNVGAGAVSASALRSALLDSRISSLGRDVAQEPSTGVRAMFAASAALSPQAKKLYGGIWSKAENVFGGGIMHIFDDGVCEHCWPRTRELIQDLLSGGWGSDELLELLGLDARPPIPSEHELPEHGSYYWWMSLIVAGVADGEQLAELHAEYLVTGSLRPTIRNLMEKHGDHPELPVTMVRYGFREAGVGHAGPDYYRNVTPGRTDVTARLAEDAARNLN